MIFILVVHIILYAFFYIYKHFLPQRVILHEYLPFVSLSDIYIHISHKLLDIIAYIRHFMIRKTLEMNQNKLKITEETLRNIIIINLRSTKINNNFIIILVR